MMQRSRACAVNACQPVIHTHLVRLDGGHLGPAVIVVLVRVLREALLGDSYARARLAGDKQHGGRQQRQQASTHAVAAANRATCGGEAMSQKMCQKKGPLGVHTGN